MKTILHISEVSSGGVLPIIANICNGLINDYHVVVVYGVRFDTPPNINEYFDKRIKLIPIKSFRRDLSFKNDIRAINEINRIVRKYHPAIVHMHSTKAGFLGRIGLLLYRCKKFYSPHGYCFLKQDDSRIKRLIYVIVELALAHMDCTTIACGRGELEYARRLNKNSICIDNGIDTVRIDSIIENVKTKKHDFTVYTVGRIGPQKNPVLFNRIAERCPDVCFVWIGEGEERKCLTSPNITVTGLVNRNQVIEMSVNYDCYLSCSLWEGLPVALLEAMYLRKECIVSNVIGNKDLIKDGLNGYIACSTNKYIELIYKVKSDGTKFGEKAHNKVLEEFSSKNMCEGYRSVYNME